MTWLDDDRFVVAWTDSLFGAYIHARIFDEFGNALTGTFTVGEQGNFRLHQKPTITTLSDGGFTIAWESNRPAGGDSSGYAIRLQAFDANAARTAAKS